MLAYIARRIALIPLTLLGIIALNFAIVQVAPGGPVEQVLAKIKGVGADSTSRFNGTRNEVAASGSASTYRGAQGTIRNSSRTWSASSASTSRPMNGSS